MVQKRLLNFFLWQNIFSLRQPRVSQFMNAGRRRRWAGVTDPPLGTATESSYSFIHSINSTSPKSDQQRFSPKDINAQRRKKVMKITRMVSLSKIL